MQRAQGDLAAALTSYEASLAISERLAKPMLAMPGGSATSRVSHNKIGDVQVERATWAALTSASASLDH